MANKKVVRKNIIYLADTHDFALRIVNYCGSHWNMGAICKKHAWLDLQKATCRDGRYLIGEIAAAGGNFKKLPGYRPAMKGATHCWGGTAYEGGFPFESKDAAINYLKRYFIVRTCP